MQADGPEQREADAQERSWADEERIGAIESAADELNDVAALTRAETTLATQITRFGETAYKIKLERDEAHAALKDIIRGADMMLQPMLQWPGSVRHYIEEVKRVATQGLTP